MRFVCSGSRVAHAEAEPKGSMSKHRKHAVKPSVVASGMPWIVPGLFIGLLVGAISEAVYGISMFRMLEGSVAGLVLGALADFIRSRLRKRGGGGNPGQKRRG